MAMFNPYKKYENQSVMMASPGELTLMLYNGCIKFINIGINSIENDNVEEAHNSILRAQDIIDELSATLDMQHDISKSMQQLYDYMRTRLIDANISKDVEILQEVEGMVREMRDTWAEVIKVNRKQRYGNDR